MTIKTPVLCATLLFYCWNQNLITTMAEVKHMPPAHTNIARAGDLRRIPAIDAHICLWMMVTRDEYLSVYTFHIWLFPKKNKCFNFLYFTLGRDSNGRT